MKTLTKEKLIELRAKERSKLIRLKRNKADVNRKIRNCERKIEELNNL